MRKNYTMENIIICSSSVLCTVCIGTRSCVYELCLQARDDGNVMMDSPRFNKQLAKMLDKKGGVSLMVMSHIDDVGDHQT